MSSNDARADAARQADSVVELASGLVRLPSRGGVDAYEPVLRALEDWLVGHDVRPRRLCAPDGDVVGLLVEITGGRPGPWWALNACVDTAPFGDETAWSFSPTAGDVVDGWLRGRGAADSKIAAAMFCHIATEVRARSANLAGGVGVLLDVDEHTGRFGGARAYLADERAHRPAGVMIGYPGPDHVVVGGRGLWRATLSVYAEAGHSGSRRTVPGAVTRAAELVRWLDGVALAERADADGAGFPLSPKLSITAISGGEGFSVTPDRCELNVDVRTTPAFTAGDAEKLVRAIVTEFDGEYPSSRPTDIAPVASWPPFQLRETDEPAAALLRSAAAAGMTPAPKTAGPSNIGNLLAGEGIPATAGFGLAYEGLHGTDERVHLDRLPHVHAAYLGAVLDLLHAR